MGRRTTSTTKGGKFMNPTDQARKEARRRELKKNKKQRIAVRQAVIKTKNPYQMITELEDLDNMELDPTAEFQYNEKVIREKRRKLLETLIRVVEFYFKEDIPKGHELKGMIENYKINRAKKEMYHESVRNAQMVEINNIPLPETPFETPQLNDIPLPGIKPHSILKKPPPGPPVGLPPPLQTHKTPPGPPPGVPPAKKVFGRQMKPGPAVSLLPPQTSMEEDRANDDDDPYDPEEGPELLDDDINLPPDLEDDDDDEEFHHRDDDDDDLLHGVDDSDDEGKGVRKRSVRFMDDGDDDEEREEGTSRDPSSSTVTPLQAMMLKLAGQSVPAKDSKEASGQDEDFMDDDEPLDEEGAQEGNRSKPPGPPPGLPPGPPPGMPPAMMGRPGIMPPGPPPGRPPTMPMNMGPRMMGHPEGDGRMPDHGGMRMMQNPNVLSAPPSLIHRSSDKDLDETQAATITAKPKLTTNPKVDSTRFMPTSLRIRREVKGRSSNSTAGSSATPVAEKQSYEKKRRPNASTADAAYDSFMKEMQGLL